MRCFRLPLALVLGVASALAQTTGVPGINDLTIDGLGSGTTSCSTRCFPNDPVAVNLRVTAPPGSLVLALFSFCPCLPCSVPGFSNACVPPIPGTACGGSNQSLDLDLGAGCGIAMTSLMVPDSAGVPSLSVPIPTLIGPQCATALLSVQGVVIDPCGYGLLPIPGPFVFTQAVTLLF
ncbi:MAG TPA: hypothetical protein VF384_15770 [Planctomycetota bacterium]